MHVLIAIVSPTEHSTLMFASSMRDLQNTLMLLHDMHITICVVKNLQMALRAARDKQSREPLDALVAIDSTVGFPVSFVVRALNVPAPFVAGIYPLPMVDWDRVQERATKPGNREETKYTGCVYNLDPSKAVMAPHGYVRVHRIELKAVVLKKTALEALLGLVDAKEVPDNDAVCDTWCRAGPENNIWADLECQCANFGMFPYNGTIGERVFQHPATADIVERV